MIRYSLILARRVLVVAALTPIAIRVVGAWRRAA